MEKHRSIKGAVVRNSICMAVAIISTFLLFLYAILAPRGPRKADFLLVTVMSKLACIDVGINCTMVILSWPFKFYYEVISSAVTATLSTLSKSKRSGVPMASSGVVAAGGGGREGGGQTSGADSRKAKQYDSAIDESKDDVEGDQKSAAFRSGTPPLQFGRVTTGLMSSLTILKEGNNISSRELQHASDVSARHEFLDNGGRNM
eukprot:jgi/Bigna1/136366/aug1.33_g11074